MPGLMGIGKECSDAKKAKKRRAARNTRSPQRDDREGHVVSATAGEPGKVLERLLEGPQNSPVYRQEDVGGGE